MGGTLSAGQPAQCPTDMVRAGHASSIHKHADETYDDRYVGYYLGGGASLGRGEGRSREEGTWGVDYKPIIPGFQTSVILNWWHGRRLQDGSGQYEPDQRNDPFQNKRYFRRHRME